MARLGIYEVQLMAALALRGGEAREKDLAGAFVRPSRFRQAIEGLADARAVIWDKQAFTLRLQRGRCLELLGLERVADNQGGMFTEECLLPVPAIRSNETGPPAQCTAAPIVARAAAGAVTAAEGAAAGVPYTRDVLEFRNLGTRVPRDLGAVSDQTRLNGPARAHFEQAATDRAKEIAARYRADGYLADKLVPRRRLREELFEGKTPTSRKFAVLYESDPDRAREILGAAVLADNPAANLNTRLQQEGVRY